MQYHRTVRLCYWYRNAYNAFNLNYWADKKVAIKIHKIQKEISSSPKGQALVEFVLIIPIFILLVIGIIEFGNLLMTMNLLTNASREGARIAAVTDPDASLVQTTVDGILNSAGYTALTISITGPVSITREVTVTVQITYISITGGIIPGLDSLVLQRSATFRWEG